MKYLECIQLLSYLLEKLYAEQRKQVPVSVMDEVQMIVVGINKKLEELYKGNPTLSVRVTDLQSAIIAIKNTAGLEVLTESMKSALVDGIIALRDELCIQAFIYFRTNEFEPTPKVVKVMRTVVEVSLSKGVV